MIIHGGDSSKLKQRRNARNEPGARRNAIEQTQKRFAHHRVSVQHHPPAKTLVLPDVIMLSDVYSSPIRPMPRPLTNTVDE